MVKIVQITINNQNIQQKVHSKTKKQKIIIIYIFNSFNSFYKNNP